MKNSLVKFVKIVLPIVIFCIAAFVDTGFKRDYIAFITGAKVVLQGQGADLYKQSTQFLTQTQILGKVETFLPYINPPFVVLFYIPLALMPLQVSTVVMVALFVLMLSYASFKVGKNLWFYIFGLYFVTSSIYLGQTSIIILTALALSFIQLKKGNWLLFGILYSFTLLKVHYLVALPFILIAVENKKDFIKGYAGGAFLFGILSLLVSGPYFIPDYIRFLIRTEESGNQDYSYLKYSIQMMWHQIFSVLVSIGLSIVTYLISLGVVIKNKSKLSPEIIFAFSLLIIPLYSLHTFGQDLVYLSIVALIISLSKSISKPEYLGFLAIVYLLIPVFDLTIPLVSHLSLVFVYLYFNFLLGNRKFIEER